MDFQSGGVHRPLGRPWRFAEWLLALVLITGAATICCVTPQESELGHRTAFYRSLIAKGDLNIIDQVPPRDRWLVTQTYNHPTHLGTGVVTLWYPFYEYVRLLLPSSAAADTPFISSLTAYQVAGVIRNIFLLAVSALLISACLRDAPRWLLPALLLSTPILWFGVFEPFRIETTALAIAALLTAAVLDSLGREPKPASLFALGLGIGTGYSVVTAFLIYALPVGCRLLVRRRGLLRNGFAFGAGLAIPIGLTGLNALIRSGSFWPVNYYRLGVLTSGESAHTLAMIFGANSFVGASPVNYLLYAGILVWAGRAIQRRHAESRSAWLAATALVFLLAVVMQGRKIASYADEIPSRMLLYVFPILALGLHEAIRPLSKRGRRVLGALLAVCFALNVLSVAQYSVKGIVLARFPSSDILSAFLEKTRTAVLQNLRRPPAEFARLSFFLPLLALLSGVLCRLARALRAEDRHALARMALIATGLATAGYATITALNVVNNSRNAQRLLDSGFLKGSVVAGGQELEAYDDVVSTIEIGILYFPPDRVGEALRARAAYLDLAMTEIREDPIGFRADWLRGCVRPSVWSEDKPCSP